MAKVNVANSQVVFSQTVLRPYYNDWNEDKNYLQILFQPEFAVQSRELTQIQSILQNQIERFGQHIFTNGSPVLGAGVYFQDLTTINLSSTFGGTTIDPSSFVNKTIQKSDSTDVMALVVDATDSNTNEPPSLFVKYLTGDEFAAGDTIKIVDENTYSNIVVSSNAFANSLMSYISDSVYFVDGYFVKVPKQSVIAAKYNVASVNVKVGLEKTKAIVTENDDVSLLDPAAEASNFDAPGAHRFKFSLGLGTRALDSVDDEEFVQLALIEESVVKSIVDKTSYSEIEETLARRTYDESGNYTVKPFVGTLKETNANAFGVRLSSGKAYISGYEYETIAETELYVPKARTTSNTITDFDLNCNYGSYITVSNVSGVFDVSTSEVFDLHNVAVGAVNHSSLANYNLTRCGSVRIRDIDFFSGDSNTAQRKYEVYIFNSTSNNNGDITKAKSLVKNPSYTSGAVYSANSNIDALSMSNGNTVSGNLVVQELSLGKTVFKYPQSYIANGISSMSYYYRRMFSSVQFTNGTSAAITAAADEDFEGATSSSNVSSTVMNNFYITVIDKQASSRANGEVIKATTSVTGSPEQVVFASGGSAGDTFRAVVLAKMQVRNTQARVKTLVLANTQIQSVGASNGTFVSSTTGANAEVYLNTGQVIIRNPTKKPSVPESLYISDIQNVVKIYDCNGGALPGAGNSITGLIDVTSRYSWSAQQRASFYDHGFITLKPGMLAPKGPLIVCTRYYKTSSDFGYFNVDSYPNLYSDITEEGTNIGTGYSLIPTYNDGAATSTPIPLRDAVDFRPVRLNASNTAISFTLGGIRTPIATTDFTSSYRYYLGRYDLVVVNPNRSIEVIRGIPAEYPLLPTKPNGAMVIYQMYVPPYTLNIRDVKLEYIDNRRYTMRDIGLLDKRLTNVEYYVSLNQIEKAAVDLQIQDVDGLNRTKYGILADNFINHKLGDTSQFDYKIAMDNSGVNFGGRAQAVSNIKSIAMTTVDSASIFANQEKIMLDYTTKVAIQQPWATKATPVADFMFADFIGQIICYPDADIFKNEEYVEYPDPDGNIGTNPYVQPKVNAWVRGTPEAPPTYKPPKNLPPGLSGLY